MLVAQFCRYFRQLAPAVTRLGYWESRFFRLCAFNVVGFSERDFASGFLCERWCWLQLERGTAIAFVFRKAAAASSVAVH